MSKKHVFFVLVILLLLTSTNVANAITPKPTPIKDAMAKDTQALKDAREQEKASIKQSRQTAKEELEQKRKEAEEKFKVQKQEFQAKLAEIRNTRKKELAQKFDTKLSTVNKNQTDRMLQTLEKMSNKLNELSAKVQTAKQVGLDTTAAEQAIANATAKLEIAKTAVVSQAGKTYTATITTEANLKINLGQAMKTLQADLTATHQTIVAAKEAFVVAIKEVNKLRIAKKAGKNKPTPTAASGL